VRDLPSGTVTFLFTDIDGSTRLLHELGAEAYAEALAEHRRVLREAFARHGGVEVDTQGDAFFVAFPTAPGALAAAAEATVALEPGPVRVRIGLHTGTPFVAEEGYVGADVHRAARIAAAGHGGQVIVSAAAAALLPGRDLRDLGEHRFRDLAAPERVYQLAGGEFPPLKTLHQTNLPTQPTSLIGRERELQEARSLLRDRRIVTLVGAGGSGKTRLALQLAADAVEEHPDGVFWVPLAPVGEAELVPSAIAQAVGARDDLGDFLAGKRLLLLLDNFEHVIGAAPAIAQLLARAPAVTLLVTSREPLRVAGEAEYPVEPLADVEAVALFAERAASAEPLAAVREICRRLDYLPLAIELAAARTKLIPPEALLARLEQRLPLLTGGRRDAPERQRTLAATIAWSYELLSPEEQSLFRRLSVFAGSFDLEAAEQICDAELGVLQELVEKSLVRRWGSGRLGMLETVAEYAANRLDESGERELLRLRHTDYFVDLAACAARAFRTPAQATWLRRLDDEHANLRSAVSFATARGDAAAALGLAGDLWLLWDARGYLEEGRRWLEAVLALDGGVPAARARALHGAGVLAWELGDYPAAEASLQRAVDLLRHGDDRAGLAHALVDLGWAHALLAQGDVAVPRRLADEGLALARAAEDRWSTAFALQAAADFGDLPFADRVAILDEAAGLYREVGDSRYEARAIGGIGWHAVLGGDYETALEYGENALSILGDDGDPTSATILNNLASAALLSGDVEAARSRITESLPILRRFGKRREAAEALWIMAAAASKDGEVERAARFRAAAQTLVEAAGSQPTPVELRLDELFIEPVRLAHEAAFRAAAASTAVLSVADAVALAWQESTA
jgi:predicted ATPase/class 3 adenylate cyclase